MRPLSNRLRGARLYPLETHKNPRWLFPTRAATNPVGRGTLVPSQLPPKRRVSVRVETMSRPEWCSWCSGIPALPDRLGCLDEPRRWPSHGVVQTPAYRGEGHNLSPTSLCLQAEATGVASFVTHSQHRRGVMSLSDKTPELDSLHRQFSCDRVVVKRSPRHERRRGDSHQALRNRYRGRGSLCDNHLYPQQQLALDQCR